MSTEGYITYADFTSRSTDELYLRIVGYDEQARIACVDRAIAEAQSYLGLRYRVDLIFAARGAEREPQILAAVLDMALFYLHERVSDLNVPNVRRKAFERACELLKGLATGARWIDLPRLPDPETGEPTQRSSLAVSSQRKRRWNTYD